LPANELNKKLSYLRQLGKDRRKAGFAGMSKTNKPSTAAQQESEPRIIIGDAEPFYPFRRRGRATPEQLERILAAKKSQHSRRKKLWPQRKESRPQQHPNFSRCTLPTQLS
jgi:hypothetical protein